MASLSDKVYKLRNEYKNRFGEYPRGWCHGEETMKEYEKYLEECLRNSVN